MKPPVWGAWPRLVLIIVLAATPQHVTARGEAARQDLTVTVDFAEKKSVSPNEPIEVRLSRPLQSLEGRLAVLVGESDLTALFAATETGLRYAPEALPLPAGETEVVVYLAATDGEWKEIARFPLRVTAGSSVALDAAPVDRAEEAAKAGETQTTESATQPDAKCRFGFDKFDLAPSLNVGLKSQFAETHFPDANRPARPRFTDATVQGSLKSEMARGAMNVQSQFDIVGSSFRNESLRFADLGERALKVDLSNHLTQLQFGKNKFVSGHTTFGAHRHLVNNFASRGLTLTIPLSGRADFSLAAMNSTSITGFGNFFGLANRRHRMFSGIFGFEVFKSRPGGLRLEAGLLDAWFQPRVNVNQGNINDTERSRGYSARVLARDKIERLRFDAGFTRSRFINPEDPLLNQGASVVPSRQVTRNGRYVDAGFDLLKEFAFAKSVNASAEAARPDQSAQPASEPKKFNVTLNLRHERVDPLFKSIGANTQADLNQNQVELTGSFGELTFTAAHTRFNDNLAGIQTILRTNTRRNSFAASTPLQGLFRNRVVAQPNPFFPRIGYTFERVRAFADFIPTGGGFDAPGAIPDQANIVQSFTAEWQFKEFRLAYRLNHSLQDNRAAGRERADLQNFTHNTTFGWNPMATLDLTLDVNFEDANNREQAATDRTLRFGFTANWQATARQSFSTTFSTIGAGDLARINNSRNLEFDLQWNYRLAGESENRFRKVQTVYFIRYSNRFARTRNLSESINNLTKLQTFNTGLNFIFF
ncbi:MAG: hypothetical protein ACREEM_10280 [Blastocatellia bacterium]